MGQRGERPGLRRGVDAASSLNFDWLSLAAPVIGSPLAGFGKGEKGVYYSQLLESHHFSASFVAKKINYITEYKKNNYKIKKTKQKLNENHKKLHKITKKYTKLQKNTQNYTKIQQKVC